MKIIVCVNIPTLTMSVQLTIYQTSYAMQISVLLFLKLVFQAAGGCPGIV